MTTALIDINYLAHPGNGNLIAAYNGIATENNIITSAVHVMLYDVTCYVSPCINSESAVSQNAILRVSLGPIPFREYSCISPGAITALIIFLAVARSSGCRMALKRSF